MSKASPTSYYDKCWRGNMKKLVYVAGPFRGKDNWQQEQNIRRAEELALEVWRLGAAAVCPHANTRFYQGALPDDTWLDGDLAILDRCDALIMTPNWSRSEGARGEYAFAVQRGIPAFTNLEQLKSWLRPSESDP
jgi:hypothetical protein